VCLASRVCVDLIKKMISGSLRAKSTGKGSFKQLVMIRGVRREAVRSSWLMSVRQILLLRPGRVIYSEDFFLAHLASAAFRAISFRCSRVNLRFRAFPPSCPK
jgi:hypothetical protein